MGYSLVNILGGLLIVTSTMVVVSKTIPSAIKWYAIQSVVLVGVLLTLGLTTGATELLMWAASAFVTKVILVPFILNRAYKKMGSPADSTLTSSIKPAWTIILTGLEVAVCFAVVTRLSLPTAEVPLRPSPSASRTSSSASRASSPSATSSSRSLDTALWRTVAT